MIKPLRIGTRSSPLALWQAHYVSDALRASGLTREIVLVHIQTSGDIIKDVALTKIGGDGVFTKEIQKALLANEVDVAVHSLKDLPTTHVDNLVLAAVPPRGPTGDVFVSVKHARFADLPTGAIVGTSSLRRRAQILHRRPDLQLLDVRGNVETRLRKLEEQNFDGIILAEAGLRRLNLAHRITEILDPQWMLPAVGQGALGLECRADDAETQGILTGLDDRATHQAALAERGFLRGMGGGCQVPMGAAAVVREKTLAIRAAVLNVEGTVRIEGTVEGRAEGAEALGQELAAKLLAQGARPLFSGL